MNFLASRSYHNLGEAGRGKGHTLVEFIEQNTMGLMAYFSDFLNDTHGWQPTAEKKLCLKAMEEMIRIGKNEIYSGLPQVGSIGSGQGVANAIDRFALASNPRCNIRN